MSSVASFHQKTPYAAPAFTALLTASAPASRVGLGMLPTPVHAWSPPGFHGLDCYIKRDDLSGCDVSGNKVRKLEFLIADALEKGHDSVITIGGAQSNHARATAVAARQLGLEAHLILRGPAEQTAGSLCGNLLFDRLVGAQLYPVSVQEYEAMGQGALCAQLATRLQAQGKRPYVVPVGGSNHIGVWGYTEFVREFMEQQQAQGLEVDHILFACGSGGTAAGLALGFRLYKHQQEQQQQQQQQQPEEGPGEEGSRHVLKVPSIHAVGVCDSPDVFYDHIRDMATAVGAPLDVLGDVTEWITLYDGMGLGYAQSTTDELAYLTAVSQATGILLDPVYSGKAAFFAGGGEGAVAQGLFSANSKVLFLHTGGVFGVYDKEKDILGCGNLPQDAVHHPWRD